MTFYNYGTPSELVSIKPICDSILYLKLYIFTPHACARGKKVISFVCRLSSSAQKSLDPEIWRLSNS